jgi:hypothetical protein
MKKVKILGSSAGHGDDNYEADKNGHITVPDHVAEILIRHHGAVMVGHVPDKEEGTANADALSKGQLKNLSQVIDAKKADLPKFLEEMGVDSIDKILKANYVKAMSYLKGLSKK